MSRAQAATSPDVCVDHDLPPGPARGDRRPGNSLAASWGSFYEQPQLAPRYTRASCRQRGSPTLLWTKRAPSRKAAPAPRPAAPETWSDAAKHSALRDPSSPASDFPISPSAKRPSLSGNRLEAQRGSRSSMAAPGTVAPEPTFSPSSDRRRSPISLRSGRTGHSPGGKRRRSQYLGDAEGRPGPQVSSVDPRRRPKSERLPSLTRHVAHRRKKPPSRGLELRELPPGYLGLNRSCSTRLVDVRDRLLPSCLRPRPHHRAFGPRVNNARLHRNCRRSDVDHGPGP
jgi:hypothetical protein